MNTEPLSDADRAILAFERFRWNNVGIKEQEIRDRFGVSPTRHYQRVNAIIDKPAALAEYPVLVKRLRRLRDARRQARAVTAR